MPSSASSTSNATNGAAPALGAATALILAAGKGTRMKSAMPKVLQPILGEPMLRYVFDSLESLFDDRVLAVVGYKAEEVEAAFPDKAGRFVLQPEQLGTGHAVQCAWPRLEAAGTETVMVVNGDAPNLHVERLAGFLQDFARTGADLAFMTLILKNPGGYGRVVRDPDGHVRGVVEAKDWDAAVHGAPTGEINAGVYCLKMATVGPLLARLRNQNASGEYYLTDLIGLAVAGGLKVRAVSGGEDEHFLGVNCCVDLIAAENALRASIVARLLESGVMLRQAESIRVGPRVAIAPGADVTGPCELYGQTSVAAGARVASHCVLIDSVVEADADIRSFSHLEKAHVGPASVVGPYARLRPGARLETGVHVGNFVEVKNSILRDGAKANHLTYLGDSEIGAKSNIGAGTITCNYDGKKKHRTVIGEAAFIGSNAALVAPVTIGAGALVGAGSVITRDVPDNTLAVARGEQKHYPRRK